ncbi:MAG: hypothetical protein CGW95_07490, partial [Phenylobacterium zucineum]
LGVRASVTLFVLFVSTFIFTSAESRWYITAIYLAAALVMFIARGRYFGPTLKALFSRELLGRVPK